MAGKKFTAPQCLALQKASSHHATKGRRNEVDVGEHRVTFSLRVHGTLLVLEDTVEVPRLDLWPVLAALVDHREEINPDQLLRSAEKVDERFVKSTSEILIAAHRARVKPKPKRGAVRGDQLHFERL